MPVPKIRIIAGPNGSGKTSFINEVRKKEYFYLHNYVNADDIQKELNETKVFSLNKFDIVVTKVDFENFLAISSFKEKIGSEITNIAEFHNNAITVMASNNNAYVAALIADFIRTQLLQQNKSFEFETVMSHSSKILFLKEAKNKGYKIYLYFLCTESPQINKINVHNRAQQGGHDVEPSKIESRYYKTLMLIKDAIETAEVSFVFQNNFKDFTTIFVTKNNVVIEQNVNIPNWFQKYYLDKL